VKKVTDIKGMARKSAEAFVQNIPTFVAFLKDCGLEYKLHPSSTYKKGIQDQDQDQDQVHIQEKDESHPLYKKSIVITGVRDKSIQEFIKQVGAHLSSSVSKKTVVVITKSKDEDTSKTLEAKKLNIPIYTVEEFKQMYHIA